jgi:hypothetical protein
MTIPDRRATRELWLTKGGPTYRLEKGLRLIEESRPRMGRRMIVSICLTWLALFILAALQGAAAGHRVEVAFLRDFAVHARFLLALPLLLLAETILGRRLADASQHFVTSGLVLDEQLNEFDAAVKKGLALRDSTIAEVFFVFVAYAITAVALRFTSVHVSTWSALRTGSVISLTWAGWWLALFCIPLFQFLTLRWLWRLFLWGQFLWRMSRLKLQLMPTHPDEAGGLAFVGEAQRFFGIILFAYAITVAGVLANGVLYDKAPLPQFAGAIAAYVVVAVLVILAPLFVFSPTLLRAKLSGLFSYGTLATQYTVSFHQKWIRGQHATDELLLGSGDIQSLADLGNSFSFIQKMKALPMGPRIPVHLALACLIPMAPLLLTVMPLKDILKLLFKAIL